MEFFCSDEGKKKPVDLLVLPFWEDKQKAMSAADKAPFKEDLQSSAIKKDFQGKEGELLFIYGKSPQAERLVLLGLGSKDKINIEKLRRAYAQLAKACHQKKIENIRLYLPIFNLAEESIVKGITEGLLLANYTFNKLKQVKKPEKSTLLNKAEFVNISKKSLDAAKKSKIVAAGVNIARDLVNDNADYVTPQYLASFAKNLARQLPRIKTTVLNKKQIEKEKMGLLLAVNRGSDLDPAVIILSYQGNLRSKEHTVLVGKGITYDTGGLNLKPCASMETMKADMAGAAAVLGTMYAAAKLGLKVNVSAVIPTTENSIDAKSFKPGDVYISSNGQTVEITNPDAEGRLVLADAITYAKKKLRPTRIIDIATLTGGIDVALGPEACGLFSNHDGLARSLQEAGERTFERVWRFPLYEEYREYLRSDIADMKNSAGRSASSSTAAMFLQEFVEKTPWAHLDIASVAYLSEKRRYHPKYATGFGVRLLVDLLSQ